MIATVCLSEDALAMSKTEGYDGQGQGKDRFDKPAMPP